PAIASTGGRARTASGRRSAAAVAAEAVCDAVFEAGGEPRVLHGGPRRALDGLPGRLAAFAGVVVPGGSDLDPSHYGQRPHPRTEPDDREQDLLDLAVLRAVLVLGLPTLRELSAGYELFDTSDAGALPDPASVAGLDGVFLLGGGDVDGALYGHTGPVPNSYGVDPKADAYAIAAIRAAERAGRPVFGICRGSQLVNV